MGTYNNVSGVWRRVSTTYDNISGTWRSVPTGYCNVGGAWRAYNFLAWSYSTTLIRGLRGGSSTGNKNAEMVFKGTYYTGYENYNVMTQLCNGTAWSESGLTPDYSFGNGRCGLQNATLDWAGYKMGTPDCQITTKLFNGSTWSTPYNYFDGDVYRTDGCGRTNDAISVCLSDYSSNDGFAYVRVSNGTAWSSTTSFPHIAEIANVIGIGKTSMIAGGGVDVNNHWTDVYSFNGSVWSAVASLVTGAEGGHYFGLRNDAVIQRGQGYTETQIYNGTAWSATAVLLDTRYQSSGTGAGAGTGKMSTGVVGSTYVTSTIDMIS